MRPFLLLAEGDSELRDLYSAFLTRRGYDVAVFHSTGMGGRAYEAIAAQKGFAAVFDLCIQEVTNHHNGSVVTSGPDRMENAGRAGIPQIVSPGAGRITSTIAWISGRGVKYCPAPPFVSCAFFSSSPS